LYLPLGWGTPLPIALISVAIRHEQYIIFDKRTGQPVACWLSWDYGTIAAFIVPMCLVLLVNGILTALVLRSVYRYHKGFGGHADVQDEAGGALHVVKKLVKAFVVILPLLGFTWIVGLLSVNEGSVVFAFFFVILNSLQGAAIFFFYVLRTDKVRPKLAPLFKPCKKAKQKLLPKKKSTAFSETMGTLGTFTTPKNNNPTSEVVVTSMSSSDATEGVYIIENREVQKEMICFNEEDDVDGQSVHSFTLQEGNVASSISTTRM
jgi:G protein-coupled receptor 133